MDTTNPIPSAVTGDTITRLALAQAPDTESQTLWQLIDDQNLTVANIARSRLGLAFRTLIGPVGATP